MKLFSGVMFVLPLIVSAQSMDATDPFTLSISPQYPRPYSTIVINPTSNAVNLANAVMTVVVDGKEIYKGNAQPAAVTLDAPGVLTSVKVTMTSDGTPYTKTLSLRPQDVAIIAEPISSAPVLYPGKPLVPIEGTVRVVAVAQLTGANGKAINPATLSYEWTIDGTRIANASGIGRDAIIMASPLQYRNRDVSVSVQSQDGSVASGASLSLTAEEPIVRIYRNDPLLGVMFDRAISNSYDITSAESSLYGAAYSFPASAGAPLIKWFLNGALAQTGSMITLRPTGSGKGNASLSLVASAGELTTATVNLSLSFGAVSGEGFFGL